MKSTSSRPSYRLFQPLSALAFASGASCALLAARSLVLGRHPSHSYLVWNLILAWLPLLFALRVHRDCEPRKPWRWRALAAALGWLLFFPNAPYIFTDLVHLGPRSNGAFWVDLVLILVFALTGLVLGFLSLFLMHNAVAERWGWRAGWVFALIATGLAGFGIYLGRFLRRNSWDVLADPFGILGDIAELLGEIHARPAVAIISALFATQILLGYVILHGLTRLTQPGRSAPGLPDGRRAIELPTEHDPA